MVKISPLRGYCGSPPHSWGRGVVSAWDVFHCTRHPVGYLVWAWSLDEGQERAEKGQFRYEVGSGPCAGSASHASEAWANAGDRGHLHGPHDGGTSVKRAGLFARTERTEWAVATKWALSSW